MSTCSFSALKVQCCSRTWIFYIVLASGMSCKFCGKVFNRGFKLRRHENDYCSLKNQQREASETESSHTMDSEDDGSTDSTLGSESPVSTTMRVKLKRIPGCHCMVDEAMQSMRRLLKK